jgi:hypothetical protein
MSTSGSGSGVAFFSSTFGVSFSSIIGVSWTDSCDAWSSSIIGDSETGSCDAGTSAVVSEAID